MLLARSRREAQKAAIEAQQLGQYKLERKLGAGGMGVVYKGHHAMLRRPTAIKMLDVDKVNEGSIERFEREVQITSQLNNPNTVAIYDYGRTPEGVFYYAMEFLDGIDLQSLVERYGPQPVPRVIHILRADLRLAVRSPFAGPGASRHQAGQHHAQPPRRRARRREGARLRPGESARRAAAGRPHAASVAHRHAALHVARGDSDAELGRCPQRLYAVGAVGYFLLTGQPVFEADNVVDLCQKHVATPPMPPSERTRTPIPAELEAALLACLEKSRAKRPQTARDLALLICALRRSARVVDRRRRRLVGPPRTRRTPSQPRQPLPSAHRTAGHSHDMTIDQPAVAPL